ncbi:hypothetical protein [Enterovirga aerilata]|uniref:Uncharacterized protein n=1 Tax=Enterovirga aerilata TaxID=2730920 RepID=A0A849HWV2_9HYPH|nr:hypothetical protein [Enterovirga sp. DB1703]NNM72016.1 hypothetical protein [Enterovirga sp. DB1703]
MNIMPRMPQQAAQAVTRVQVQVQLSARLGSAATAEEQLETQEGLRRALYAYAAKECALITEVFKSECRLAALNLSSHAMPRGAPGNDSTTVGANATYELTPKPTAN